MLSLKIQQYCLRWLTTSFQRLDHLAVSKNWKIEIGNLFILEFYFKFGVNRQSIGTVITGSLDLFPRIELSESNLEMNLARNQIRPAIKANWSTRYHELDRLVRIMFTGISSSYAAAFGLAWMYSSGDGQRSEFNDSLILLSIFYGPLILNRLGYFYFSVRVSHCSSFF